MRQWTMPALSTRYSTLPALASRTALSTSMRDRADLGVRHQAARTEHPTELADGAHHVRRRDHAIEVHEALGHLRDQLVRSRRSRRPRPALPSLCRPWRTPSTRTVLPVPCGQHDGSADHLVGVLRVDAQAHRDVDALVELGGAGLLDQAAHACSIE